ncbi:unnamed protein product [Anisakis simplex]|uniref:CaMBD domain-containing protein n=1 Tax=Anisakis simplex TaxID=6269 RepID=A0A0M3JUT9_ANISI|nr:unnamed protein product [Anisakis simplex]
MLETKTGCSFVEEIPQYQNEQCSPASQLADCPHIDDDQHASPKQQWTLSTNAFHQSFDERSSGQQTSLSNSCGELNDPCRFQRKRRSAYCSGVGRPNYNSGTNSAGGGVAISQTRPPALRSPQSSFDSNSNVGQKTNNVNCFSNDAIRSSEQHLSDTQIISLEDGSKKSLSLVLSEDLEGQRNGPNQDDSETPLMKQKEKNCGRLLQRQELFLIRRTTSDYALFFAVLGIVLMIVENEMSAAHLYEKLFMNANSAEDWRIAITWKRIMQITAEIIACATCPLPINVTFAWTTLYADGETKTTSNIPLDVLLSIPMFFRLYWLCRVMLLHSRLFTDASSRSIAGLNRVNFNARFILKTLMTLCPGTMLMVFTASLWIIAGWILRLCERHYVSDPINVQAQKHQNYLNSLWLIAITFLSVGYGDIVPNTYCGRAMAVVTGVLGTCTSSMVVAVIARKLELSRAEKHVHNFMMDTQLTKQLKHSAANVLRETWLIYKHRCLVNKIDPAKIRMHQRKFLVAIYSLRKVKRDQRKLAENLVSLGDVAKTTSNTYELIHDISTVQEGLSLRMTAVEHHLSDISREISFISDSLKANKAMMKRANWSNQNSSVDDTVSDETIVQPFDSVRKRRNLADP